MYCLHVGSRGWLKRSVDSQGARPVKAIAPRCKRSENHNKQDEKGILRGTGVPGLPVAMSLGWPLPQRRRAQTDTVTRKNVAGIEVEAFDVLWFWLVNSASSSDCRSVARLFFSAASKAFIVGP
jgi:hypothetical protein